MFEPSAESVLGYLLGQYLNIYIYYVLLNAKASEQSARMVSMKNATDSAEDLIKALTLEYNKLRQGNITKELLGDRRRPGEGGVIEPEATMEGHDHEHRQSRSGRRSGRGRRVPGRCRRSTTR